MRTIGIIAEYNPFHNGHEYHIKTAKAQLKADYVVVAMSGNFVQRGEPAITHKWKRTEMCLLGGADLVIELPIYYAASGAEYFARGAVKLLNATNIISHLSFGAECLSTADFEKALTYITEEPLQYKALIKEYLSMGNSFPAARASALNRLLPHVSGMLSLPNNILGVEYLKALRLTKSSIKPHIVKRHLSQHNSTTIGENFSSASAIRNSIHLGKLGEIKGSVPDYCYKIIKNSGNVLPISFDSFSDMLVYKIKTSTQPELERILDISEGIENRVRQASHISSILDIIPHIKTKRYTFTKIQRILLHILLDIKQEDLMLFEQHGGPQYVRVLGFKKTAEPLLNRLTKESSLPVIINLKKDMKKLNNIQEQMLKKEISTTDIYFIKCKEPFLRKTGAEYTQPIVVIRE